MSKISNGAGPQPLPPQATAGQSEFARLLRSATAPDVPAPATAPHLASAAKAGRRPPLLATRQALLLEDALQQPPSAARRPLPGLIRLVRRANERAAAKGDTALEMVEIHAEGGADAFTDARVGTLIFINDDITTQWRDSPGSPVLPALLERHVSDYLADG